MYADVAEQYDALNVPGIFQDRSEIVANRGGLSGGCVDYRSRASASRSRATFRIAAGAPLLEASRCTGPGPPRAGQTDQRRRPAQGGRRPTRASTQARVPARPLHGRLAPSPPAGIRNRRAHRRCRAEVPAPDGTRPPLRRTGARPQGSGLGRRGTPTDLDRFRRPRAAREQRRQSGHAPRAGRRADRGRLQSAGPSTGPRLPRRSRGRCRPPSRNRSRSSGAHRRSSARARGYSR